MKFRIQTISLVLLLLVVSEAIAADRRESTSIYVNPKENTLVAPSADSYTWYLNGKLLESSGQTIPVAKAGEYLVVYETAKGEINQKSVKVALNAEGKVIRIYTIGDSTVQDYQSGYYPQTGWGQVLHYFFKEENVVVDNRAIGGTSSKSFYNQYWKTDGKYEQLVNELDSGDYVFIQFGINDAAADTARHTEPFGSFQDYLTLYVEESQAKGAIPVIVATLRRNAWNTDGTVYPAYHDYPVAARELAADLDVPLIDLDEKCGELMMELGKDYVTSFWYMNLDPGEYSNYPVGNSDNVHFQRSGAIEMARLVVQELQNDTSYSSVDSVAYYLSDMYQVEVLRNDPEAGRVTRTASYPEGLEVTLKAKPNGGYVFNEWQNKNEETVSTDKVYTFTMGSSDTSYTAIFEYLGYGTTELWIEAECGEVGSLWNIVDDTLASNGKYVTVKPGNNSANSVPGTSGRITYTFNVTEGIYNIYGRILFPSVNDDSYYMQVDGGLWSKITWDAVIADWGWRELISADFSDGEHVMTIAYREDGTLIDKFHIGTAIPSGIGTIDTSFCNQPVNIEYLREEDFSQKIWTDATHTVYISYDIKKPANIHYSIINSMGQIVCRESLGYLNEGVHTHAVNLDLDQGVYILSSRLEEQLKTEKFLVN